MIDDQVKSMIKEHLKDYLEEKGINTTKPFNCLNPQHEDKNPSMSYDPKRNICKCFSCNTSYDLISLYALDNNLDITIDFKEIMARLGHKYNINVIQKEHRVNNEKKELSNTIKKEDYTKYFNKCKKNIDKTDYLTRRGLSEEIIKKHNIGYDLTNKMVVFPISKYYYLGRYTDDKTQYKHHKPKGATNELFNAHYLKDSDFKSVIWVTESIIDSLSLEEINHDIKTIALNSTTNANQLINEIKDNNFKGYLILALDTDTTGIRASQELKEDLEVIGVNSFIFNKDYDDYNLLEEAKAKDINDMLVQNKEKLTNKVNSLNDMVVNMLEQKELNTLKKHNVYNYLDTFNELVKNQDNNKPLTTGIKPLDTLLGGGLYKKQLIVIGAKSGIGKTTLALQIADNVAREGNDVLVFSLEMAKEELIARSISRLMFLKAVDDKIGTYHALSQREILRGIGLYKEGTEAQKTKDLYQYAINEYKENIASNMYIEELDVENSITIEKIKERVQEQVKITKKQPLVIIDYLQIIQNKDKYLSDKQAIDKIVVGLKRLARDENITIILISSFNRTSYNQESTNASFKESGSIEYTSDITIAIDKTESKDYNDIMTIKTMKNRNERPQKLTNVSFYGKYNYYGFNDSTIQNYKED